MGNYSEVGKMGSYFQESFWDSLIEGRICLAVIKGNWFVASMEESCLDGSVRGRCCLVVVEE